MLLPETEAHLIELLAWVYKSIPWRSIHVRNPHDVFNHRVRSAARRGTIYGFTSKLCNYFGLQTLYSKAIPLIQQLRPHEVDVLHALSTEHIPFCIQAIVMSKELRFGHYEEKEDVTPIATALEG